MDKNRREFFRIFLHGTVSGQISVAGCPFEPLQIEDISVKGLRFLSSENLLRDMPVCCDFAILDQEFLLEGKIIRKEEKEDLFEYGIVFRTDQRTESALFKQLNYYQIRLRKGEIEV